MSLSYCFNWIKNLKTFYCALSALGISFLSNDYFKIIFHLYVLYKYLFSREFKKKAWI
jgi:hypothetical protein